MKEDFYKDITTQAFELIKAIGEKLGVASDHIYYVLIKQQILEGIMLSLSSMFLGILAFFGIKLLIKLSKIAFSDEDTEFGKSCCFSMGIFLSIIGFFSLAQMQHAIPKIINPEYAAIHEIISTIKN